MVTTPLDPSPQSSLQDSIFLLQTRSFSSSPRPVGALQDAGHKKINRHKRTQDPTWISSGPSYARWLPEEGCRRRAAPSRPHILHRVAVTAKGRGGPSMAWCVWVGFLQKNTARKCEMRNRAERAEVDSHDRRRNKRPATWSDTRWMMEHALLRSTRLTYSNPMVIRLYAASEAIQSNPLRCSI